MAGDAGRAESAAVGEKTRPFGGPAVGVSVPDPAGEPVAVGSEVVDWKSVERDALERRYGRLVRDARGDRAGFDGRPLATSRFVSESESCGDCSGSSGVGGIRRGRCCPARQSAGAVCCSGHLSPAREMMKVVLS